MEKATSPNGFDQILSCLPRGWRARYTYTSPSSSSFVNFDTCFLQFVLILNTIKDNQHLVAVLPHTWSGDWLLFVIVIVIVITSHQIRWLIIIDCNLWSWFVVTRKEVLSKIKSGSQWLFILVMMTMMVMLMMIPRWFWSLPKQSLSIYASLLNSTMGISPPWQPVLAWREQGDQQLHITIS